MSSFKAKQLQNRQGSHHLCGRLNNKSLNMSVLYYLEPMTTLLHMTKGACECD